MPTASKSGSKTQPAVSKPGKSRGAVGVGAVGVGVGTSRISRARTALGARAASRPASIAAGSPGTSTVGGGADGPSSVNWLRSIRFSGFTVLMFVVLVLFVVVVAPGARIFIEQRQQIADLQNNIAAAQAENASLTGEVARWSDPAYIRTEARDRLYFVMPGETSFLVLDDSAAESAPSTAPVSTSIQTTQTNWMASLFSSAMTAALSTQSPDQLATVPGTGR